MSLAGSTVFKIMYLAKCGSYLSSNASCLKCTLRIMRIHLAESVSYAKWANLKTYIQREPRVVFPFFFFYFTKDLTHVHEVLQQMRCGRSSGFRSLAFLLFTRFNNRSGTGAFWREEALRLQIYRAREMFTITRSQS